jgi:hypothetical protein
MATASEKQPRTTTTWSLTKDSLTKILTYTPPRSLQSLPMSIDGFYDPAIPFIESFRDYRASRPFNDFETATSSLV